MRNKNSTALILKRLTAPPCIILLAPVLYMGEVYRVSQFLEPVKTVAAVVDSLASKLLGRLHVRVSKIIPPS